MASSETQIANLALAKLGQARLNNMSEDTGPEARWAAELYPSARDYVIEDIAPRSARTTASLTQLTTNEREDDYTYAYVRPSDAMAVLYLLPERGPFDPGYPIRFECETDSSDNEVIYTDERSARVVYVRQLTDVTKFVPSLTDAIAWYLAHLLVQPLKQDQQQFVNMLNGYRGAKANAIEKFSREMLVIRDATESMPEWHRFR